MVKIIFELFLLRVESLDRVQTISKIKRKVIKEED